jgi:flagellar motor switch protein FliM
MAVSEGGEQGGQAKLSELKATEPETAPAGDPRAEPAEPLRPLDFSQPTKFTPEIRHRMAGVLDAFTQALAVHLADELDVEVELSVAEVTQQTWAAARAQLAADSIAVGVKEESIAHNMLLSVELGLVLPALECLLGGQAAQAPAQRHLTEVDWALARGLLEVVVGELSRAWVDVGGPALKLGALDMEGDAGVLAPIGEPTLAFAIQSRIDGESSAMTLLVPWAAIEPVAESIGGSGPPSHGLHGQGSDALRRRLSDAKVMLRAEVGSVQMPIERVLELLPGTLVALERRVEDGVRLFAEGISLGNGRPGRSGNRRAIKLESADQVPTRAATYATLGRAELQRARAQAGGGQHSGGGPAVLQSMFVRVWAELGRTHLPLGEALELTVGAVVELDRGAQAPVELFVNGQCFANGRLVVTSDEEWGVQVDELV